MSESNTKVVAAVPAVGSLGSLLTVAFVVLKLCGVIAWSWWWVLSPLWIPIALWLVIIICGAVITGVVALTIWAVVAYNSRQALKDKEGKCCARKGGGCCK